MAEPKKNEAAVGAAKLGRKPKFDPSQPFEAVGEKPRFDPSQPFDVVDDTTPREAYLRKVGQNIEDLPVDPYTNLPLEGPEAVLSGLSEKETEGMNQVARDVAPTIAAIGTIPLTGGLSLPARMLATGGTTAGASLVTGLVTGQEPREALRDARNEGLIGMSGEVGGSLIAKGVTSLGGRLASGLFPATEEGLRAAQVVEEGGGVLTASRVSDSRTAAFLESVAESSILGSGEMAAAKQGAVAIAEKPVREFVDGLTRGASREQAGNVLQGAITGNEDSFRAVSDTLYQRVDDAFQEAIQDSFRQAGTIIPEGANATFEPTVSMMGVKMVARKLLAEAREGLPPAGLVSKLEEIIRRPNVASFKGAARLRSDILAQARNADSIASYNKAAGSRLAQALTDTLENTAAQAGDEVLKAYQEAKAFYKAGSDIFNDKLVRGLVKDNPASAVAAINSLTDPADIRKLRVAVGDAEAWKQIQGQYLEDIIQRSFSNAGDVERGTVASGQKIATKLLNAKDDVLREILAPAQLKTFREAVKVLERAQGRTGKGLPGINIRGGSEVAGVTLALTGSPQGLALVFTPALLGKLMTNPRAVKLLTQGFEAPAGSAAAAAAMSRIAALVAVEGGTR